MPAPPGVLARGPWDPEQVSTRWHDDHFELDADATAAADAAIAELAERGSPSHDGLSARLLGWRAQEGGLDLELQPARWSLRLVPGAAGDSLAAMCITRAHDGRWLAGRRAPWVASWAGRWALGAGGAVEIGENPVETLARELHEEWQLVPERLSVEALVRLPSGLTGLVGVAWVPDGTEPVPDEEHDAWAWWPAEVERWPAEAHEPLRRMANLLLAR
jgi:ADP-ribose pyrophosphatase YjhB (NUDIX family)